MGTTLQALGLPAGTPADQWLESAPEAVSSVHERSARCGAQVVRTATLCTRPDRDPRAFGRRHRVAVAAARESGAEQVWWSLGPAGPGRGPLDALDLLHDLAVDAILLETFVDADEALDTLAALRRRSGGHPVLVSMVPRSDGRLFDGRPLPHDALLEAGAAGVGANCGRAPADVLRMVEPLPDGPWLAAPCGGHGLPEVLRALAPRCRWLGGCCGVSPERLEAAWPSS